MSSRNEDKSRIAFQKGFDAFFAGKSLLDNPYKWNRNARTIALSGWWQSGFNEAMNEYREHLFSKENR